MKPIEIETKIKTFFPMGTIDGVKITSFTGSDLQVTVIPRADFRFLREADTALASECVYLLFDKLNLVQNCLVSDSTQIYETLSYLDEDPDAWWNFAMIISSKSGQFSKLDADFLLKKLVGKFERIDGDPDVKFHNYVEIDSPEVNPVRVYELLGIVNDLDILFKFLGVMFDKSEANQSEIPFFKFNARGSDATGTYNFRTNQVKVLAGSNLSKGPYPKSFSSHMRQTLSKLIDIGVIVNDQFVQDYIFRSPSEAASIVGKSMYNGKECWRTESGTSIRAAIDKIKHKSE